MENLLKQDSIVNFIKQNVNKKLPPEDFTLVFVEIARKVMFVLMISEEKQTLGQDNDETNLWFVLMMVLLTRVYVIFMSQSAKSTRKIKPY